MTANNHSEPEKAHRRDFTFLLVLLLLSFFNTSCNQSSDSSAHQASYFDQWENAGLLELEIETDLEQLFANKNDDAAQTAHINWKANGTAQQIEAKVSVRGKTRKEVCNFPPLKIKLDKEQMAAQGFDTQYGCLKLVTHCLDGNDELVLREYLVYQMLNELTDKNFRTQLARVTYRSANSTTEAYAFLIEDKDEMADRMNGEVIEEDEATLTAIDAEQYRLLTVFAYMIGNTDWNLTKSHNIKLVKTDMDSAPIPIPYDFDYAGVVNAPYANPHPTLPIKTVRERFFQWRGASQDGLEETLEHFRSKQRAIYNLVLDFDHLSEASKTDMLKYIDEFYQGLPQIPALAANNAQAKKGSGNS